MSSLLIIQHLLKTLDGDRKAALVKWLNDGLGGASNTKASLPRATSN